MDNIEKYWTYLCLKGSDNHNPTTDMSSATKTTGNVASGNNNTGEMLMTESVQDAWKAHDLIIFYSQHGHWESLR